MLEFSKVHLFGVRGPQKLRPPFLPPSEIMSGGAAEPLGMAGRSLRMSRLRNDKDVRGEVPRRTHRAAQDLQKEAASGTGRELASQIQGYRRRSGHS